MDAIFDDFNRGLKRLLVIAPPAVGKTAMFGGVSKYYLDKKKDSIVLVLSHLGLLVKQSGDSFKKFWKLDTDILQADKFPSANSRCILSTVQSSSMVDKISHWVQRLPKEKKVELIILDEVHINSGVTRVDKILEQYFPDSRVVGFTGSPFKDNKSMAGLFDKISYSVSINDAISMGILVPPKLHGITIDKKNLEDVMAKVISIVRQSHHLDKSVIFMKSIKDSDKMAEMLRAVGYNAVSVTSKITGEERDKILTSMRDNKKDSPQILTSVDVLSVGFDCPSLQAVIMPYGTGSVSTYLQRIGRGLRTYQDKTHCDVYIGGSDPVVEKGEWERINKKVMRAGSREEREKTELERMQEEMSKKVTLEEVRFKKKLLSKGMDTLANMIGDRRFPDDLMNHLVGQPIVNRYHAKAQASYKQIDLLGKYNIDGSRMNKNEASHIIKALAKKYNWIDNEPVVPKGKHAGQKKSDVPFSYINLVSKYGSKYYDSELCRFFKGE